MPSVLCVRETIVNQDETIDGVLELRSRVQEVKGRKVVVKATVSAAGEVCATGEVVAVEMPENMVPGRA